MARLSVRLSAEPSGCHLVAMTQVRWTERPLAMALLEHPTECWLERHSMGSRKACWLGALCLGGCWVSKIPGLTMGRRLVSQMSGLTTGWQLDLCLREWPMGKPMATRRSEVPLGVNSAWMLPDERTAAASEPRTLALRTACWSAKCSKGSPMDPWLEHSTPGSSRALPSVSKGSDLLTAP
jgi:hypothetical protein